MYFGGAGFGMTGLDAATFGVASLFETTGVGVVSGSGFAGIRAGSGVAVATMSCFAGVGGNFFSGAFRMKGRLCFLRCFFRDMTGF